MTTYQAIAERTETTVHAVKSVSKFLHIGHKMSTVQMKKIENILNLIASISDYIYILNLTSDRNKIVDRLADNVEILKFD